MNPRRIVDAGPRAAAVRTFHGWLPAGRCVIKGQKGIRLVAPNVIDDADTVRRITPDSVFDVTPTPGWAVTSPRSMRRGVGALASHCGQRVR